VQFARGGMNLVMKEGKLLKHRRVFRPIPLSVRVGTAVAAAIVIAVTVAWMSSQSSQPESFHSIWHQALNLGERTLHLTSRPPSGPVIFPYSIIPGGIHSLKNLQDAMATDPVVAAQYANFNLAKFRIVKLNKDEWAYVSYRIGSEVFWTRKKLKLCKGETLFTDGTSYFRTRCGNQVSQVPRVQVWSEEPPEAVLDTPAGPEPQTEAFATFPPEPNGSVEDAAGGAPVLPPPAQGSTPLIPGIGILPFAPIIPPPSSGCSTKNSDKDKDCQHVPPPSPVPEDSNLILVATGAAALAVYELARRKSVLRTSGRSLR
jgi:hypothetical protein